MCSLTSNAASGAFASVDEKIGAQGRPKAAGTSPTVIGHSLFARHRAWRRRVQDPREEGSCAVLSHACRVYIGLKGVAFSSV